eukprot:Hpha_TRINITY_DN9638_c0_g2::TRINITY_DN9638_c0_g2_i1::g.184550::m.184550
MDRTDQNGGGRAAIPEDPESDCLMAYAGPELESVFALEVTDQMFLYGSHNGMIKGFDLHEGELACELAGHRGTIRSLLCAPGVAGEKTLYSSSSDGTVKVWDVAVQEERATLTGHEGSVDCLDWCGGLLGSGGRDGSVRLWADGECKQTVKVHAGNIAAMSLHAVSPRQLECFTASNDGLAKYFDVATKKLIAVYEGGGPLRCILHDPEWNLLYLGGSGKNVLVYDTRVHTCVGQLRGHSDAVLGMALHKQAPPEDAGGEGGGEPPPDMKTLYTAGDDCTVRQWNLRAREEWKLQTNPAAVRPGRCPVHEGKEDYIFGGHSAGISCMKLTSEGVLYTASYDASVRVWDREGAMDNIAARQQKERSMFEQLAKERRDRADRQKGKGKGRGKKDKKSSSKKGSDKGKKKKKKK